MIVFLSLLVRHIHQGWIQHDLVGGCSGADCRVVSVMCAARPSTTVFEF